MRTCAVKVLFSLVGLIAGGDALVAHAATKVPSDWNPAALAVDIRLGTTEQQDAALAKIKLWLEIDPVDGSLHLRRTWAKPLLDTKRFAELESWCLIGMLGSLQDIGQLEDLSHLRIQALTGLDKTQEALQAAKSYFNIARSKQTAQALQLIAKCLEKAYPNDKGISERFRAEQIEGAVTDGSAKRSRIMDSIKIDASIYQSSLDRLAKQDWDDNQTIMAYGNLLLLADQGAQAIEVFSQLSQKNKRQFVESIARAYKAQDGVIGQANHYLLTGGE